MNDRNYWLGFSAFPGVGPQKFSLLLQHFKSAREAWNAQKADLKKILGESLCGKFEKFRINFSIDNYARILLVQGVSYVTLADKHYPYLLKQIKNPPFVLYYKGSEEILRFAQNDSSQSIAVVGTRRITQYGRDVTTLLTSELVAAGCTIISGLAMGVDAVAHKTTVDLGGKTIAVLGCGVDCCSPEENQNIYDEILKSGGLIVSEYPLGSSPNKGTFPSRNRIIAGLSQAVLVTEGAEDSGSLITGEYALKFNRKVFAVPGPITSSLSKGPYKLIAKGARLVTKGEDILNELKIQNSKFKTTAQNSKINRTRGETKEEQKILDLLENEPLHFDELVRRTKINSATLGGIISFMEVKGMVKSLQTGFIQLV